MAHIFCCLTSPMGSAMVQVQAMARFIDHIPKQDLLLQQL